MFRAEEARRLSWQNLKEFAKKFFKDGNNPYLNVVKKAIESAVEKGEPKTECTITKLDNMAQIEYEQHKEELLSALFGFGYEVSFVRCNKYDKILIDWYYDAESA